jgi:hypothetical protein
MAGLAAWPWRFARVSGSVPRRPEPTRHITIFVSGDGASPCSCLVADPPPAGDDGTRTGRLPRGGPPHPDDPSRAADATLASDLGTYVSFPQRIWAGGHA